MMTKLTLKIGHLYGDSMNTYGDNGNIITLTKRGEWRGIKVVVKNIPIGYKLKVGEFDLFFFGGGQDQAQVEIAKDLKLKAKLLRREVEKGIPMLSICGGYQLLGEYYKPHQGPKLKGVGVLPVYTRASYDRMIGNIVISTQFGDLVGFENHSGKTHLKKNATSLGTVIKGFGNNGEDQTEGCIYKNTIGCYMHGSLLPKNPHLADWLIRTALEVKYKKDMVLEPLDDTLELKAHEAALKMFS